jgi:hypothetical protein
MDLSLVVLLEFVFDRQPMGFVLARDSVEQVALEACEVIHIEKKGVLAEKYIGWRNCGAGPLIPIYWSR